MRLDVIIYIGVIEKIMKWKTNKKEKINRLLNTSKQEVHRYLRKNIEFLLT